MKQFAVTLKIYLNAEDTEGAQRWVEKLLGRYRDADDIINIEFLDTEESDYYAEQEED